MLEMEGLNCFVYNAKSFLKNLHMVTTVEYIYLLLHFLYLSSSRLQKEHNESCDIPDQ